MKQSIVLVSVMCLLVSCAGISKNIAIYEDSAFAESDIHIRSVEVFFDYVKQPDVSAQLFKTAEILLFQDVRQTGKKQAFLDIQVSQRTFLQGVEPKISLYLSAVVSGENGDPLAGFTLSQAGSQSIVSAVTQNNLLKQLLSAIREELKKVSSKSE